MTKEHKGTIWGKIVYVRDGSILMGMYEHPDGRFTIRMTSLIVNIEGREVETLNSRYTFFDSEEIPLCREILEGEYLSTSLE